MAKWKFDPIDIDAVSTEPTEKEKAQKEADRTGKPVAVKGVGTAHAPRLDPEEALEVAKKIPVETRKSRGDLEQVITQLQNIWEKVNAIELIVTAQFGKKTEPWPKTTNGGHPIAANGMVAKWQEVPTKEQLLQAAKNYIGKHGKGAYDKLLAEFKAKKMAEVTKDEDQAKLMEKLQA